MSMLGIVAMAALAGVLAAGLRLVRDRWATSDREPGS